MTKEKEGNIITEGSDVFFHLHKDRAYRTPNVVLLIPGYMPFSAFSLIDTFPECIYDKLNMDLL